MLGDCKVICREDFEIVNRLGLNRGVTNDCLTNMDPSGVNLLTPIMLHNGTEMRCKAFLKMKDSMTPAEVEFDIPVDMWEKLESYEEFLEVEA